MRLTQIKGSIVSLSITFYPHCSVLVGSRKGFKRDMYKLLSQYN